MFPCAPSSNFIYSNLNNNLSSQWMFELGAQEIPEKLWAECLELPRFKKKKILNDKLIFLFQLVYIYLA